MKKFYIIAVAAALCAGNAVAQDKPQLPNADFEGAWNDCVPWTSNGNTKTMGTTPADWCIAQVIGISGTGKTLVGVKDTGYNGEGSCVKVVNSNNSTKWTQVVPGYVTLGTTWSTAKGFTGSNPDGGTFGGIDFTGRPESVTFVYKRVHGTTNADGSEIYSNTGNTEEKATVVAYLWKGEYEQADVPGNIIVLGTPQKVTMVNRDRNILDMETAQGGAVTKKGKLIGKINYDITGDAEDWTELTIPFEYLTEDTPEKFNIIFCAGDYFSTTPGAGNALYIDNVKLNYPAAVVDTKKYVGTLTVQLGEGEPSVSDQDVYMDQLSDGKYRLRLENFGADPTKPDDKGMGSIVVLCTIDNGVVSGHADGISLEGGITANADVSGTLDGSKLQLNIDVVWLDMPDMPIKVTFNGEVKTDGISDIEIDSNAAPVYYNLQGVRVANPENGLFIEVRGNKAVKVIK